MTTETTTAPPPATDGARDGRPPLLTASSVAIVVLAGALPFAVYLSGNATVLVHPGIIWLDAAVWAVLWFAAFVGVRAVTRDRSALSVAAVFTAFSLSFWNFGRWLPHEAASTGHRIAALALWAFVTLLACVLAYRMARNPSFGTFLIIFLAVWTLAAFGGFVLTRQQVAAGTPLTVAQPFTAPFVDHPNVYWFLFDEHARTDQLGLMTGADNRWLGDDLSDRGFSVSTSSYSAYLHTQLSVASTLAMDYPFTPGGDYRADFLTTNPIIMGDNPVVKTFEANGYRYVYAPDGSVEWVACPPETIGDRVCIPPYGGMWPFEGPNLFLVRATPVGSLPIPQIRNDLRSVMAGLDQVDDTDQPMFVYAHILAPHFPHRYQPDCTLRDEFVEGYQLSGAERLANYATDATCLDHEFVDTVDTILEKDPDAVIIMQSDHGSRFSFDWDMHYDQWVPANFRERFGALNAIRLPESCRGDSIEGQPLVNTYRLLFACLAGTDPDLLPTRTFFSEFHAISTLTEVPPEVLTQP